MYLKPRRPEACIIKKGSLNMNASGFKHGGNVINPESIAEMDHHGVSHIGGVPVAKLKEAVQLLVQATHNNAVLHGWWPDGCKDNPLHYSNKLCLIHSEVSEAMEGDRKKKPDSHLPEYPASVVELADAVIRIGDLAGGYDQDLASALVDKMLYNQRRADHKPEARAAAGGKTY
jgi:hypothetical protein